MRTKVTCFADGRDNLVEQIPDATPEEIAASEAITAVIKNTLSIEMRIAALESLQKQEDLKAAQDAIIAKVKL